jgi:hypothetical protein
VRPDAYETTLVPSKNWAPSPTARWRAALEQATGVDGVIEHAADRVRAALVPATDARGVARDDQVLLELALEKSRLDERSENPAARVPLAVRRSGARPIHDGHAQAERREDRRAQTREPAACEQHVEVGVGSRSGPRSGGPSGARPDPDRVEQARRARRRPLRARIAGAQAFTGDLGQQERRSGERGERRCRAGRLRSPRGEAREPRGQLAAENKVGPLGDRVEAASRSLRRWPSRWRAPRDRQPAVLRQSRDPQVGPAVQRLGLGDEALDDARQRRRALGLAMSASRDVPASTSHASGR